jgi:hypothetical protein
VTLLSLISAALLAAFTLTIIIFTALAIRDTHYSGRHC